LTAQQIMRANGVWQHAIDVAAKVLPVKATKRAINIVDTPRKRLEILLMSHLSLLSRARELELTVGRVDSAYRFGRLRRDLP
jgi:hypothetical protein